MPTKPKPTSHLGRIASKGSGARLNGKQYRLWHYAYGQHALICETLGVSPDPEAPGDTAFEAVIALKEEVEELRREVSALMQAQSG